MDSAPVDSQDYRFPFEISSTEEVPLGFVLSEPMTGVIAGLFLPSAGHGWLRRATPPRLLLMRSSELTIVTHSKFAVPSISIPLIEITSFECGHALLIGWIRLDHGGSSLTLPYNTRTWRPIDKFMRRLRALLFPNQPVSKVATNEFGAALDIKFTNARNSELDAGETVAISFFECSAELPRTLGWLSFRRHGPANFLAITNRRVLWISDRVDNRFERYSVINRSRRLASLVRFSFDIPRNEIALAFSAAADWRIPVRAESISAALSFVESAQIHQGVDSQRGELHP